MSNTETFPPEIVCETQDQAGLDILVPRDVPLGGPRAMDVRRTLPQRARSLIGPWCFLDHYGPHEVADTGGMRVPRHPHTGLQTVSWLFTGQVDHRDSAGFHATVRPGEVNLMTAGYGISHSEFSTPDTNLLHGVQLWLALLAGSTSPITTHTPLLGAELVLEPGAELTLDIDPSFEHGLLVDTGTLVLDGREVPKDHLAYLPVGRSFITLASGDEPLRLMFIGGEPFGEQIVMWWNFVGRSHEEIVGYRSQWQDEIGAEDSPRPAYETPDPPRFGTFPPGQPDPLPAPALPNTRMRPRS